MPSPRLNIFLCVCMCSLCRQRWPCPWEEVYHTSVCFSKIYRWGWENRAWFLWEGWIHAGSLHTLNSACRSGCWVETWPYFPHQLRRGKWRECVPLSTLLENSFGFLGLSFPNMWPWEVKKLTVFRVYSQALYTGWDSHFCAAWLKEELVRPRPLNLPAMLDHWILSRQRGHCLISCDLMALGFFLWHFIINAHKLL